MITNIIIVFLTLVVSKDKNEKFGIYIKNTAKIISNIDSSIKLASVYPVFIEKTVSEKQARRNWYQLLFRDIDKLRDEYSVIISNEPLFYASNWRKEVSNSSADARQGVTTVTIEPEGAIDERQDDTEIVKAQTLIGCLLVLGARQGVNCCY